MSWDSGSRGHEQRVRVHGDGAREVEMVRQRGGLACLAAFALHVGHHHLSYFGSCLPVTPVLEGKPNANHIRDMIINSRTQ
jgi:hypothetical protein